MADGQFTCAPLGKRVRGCDECGKGTKKFLSSGKSARFCGEACRSRFHSSRKQEKKVSGAKEMICASCGKVWVAIGSSGWRKRRCHECDPLRSVDKRVAKRLELRTCAECGSGFTLEQTGRIVLCSDACLKSANKRSRKMREEQASVANICGGCGRPCHRQARNCKKCSALLATLARSEKCAAVRKRKAPHGLAIHNVKCCCGVIFKTTSTRTVGCTTECTKSLRLERRRKYSRQEGREKLRNVKSCKVCGVRYCGIPGMWCRDTCSDECKGIYQKPLKRASRKAAKARRRAAKKSAGVAGVVRHADVFSAASWKCQFCGCDTPKHLEGTTDGDAPEMDHIIPLALSGPHTRENLQCLCRTCNQLKGAMHPNEFAMRFKGMGMPG